MLEPPLPPPDPAEEAELGRALDTALDRLRPDYRMAVLLRPKKAVHAEIGESLSIPEGTAKTFVHRGRKLLAEMLDRAGWRPV